MLKERIDYLCKKKEITRKDLVEGLVTQAHFANILAERYPLPEDLAEQIAERLGVSKVYLERTAADDLETLQRAEQIFERLSMQASSIPEQEVNDLPDRDNTLTIELTTALMKATYFQQLNDHDAYDYLHQSYLNFYLDKFGRPDDILLPIPLLKALLFYKIQHFRSKHQYYDVLHQVERWIALLQTGSETWLTAQHIRMEAYVHTKQFEEAKKTFEQIMKQVYEQRWFHRLSGLYIIYSGYCFSMKFIQESLTTLSMAEAHLVYAEHQSDMLSVIMNNRIIMLTMTEQLEQAEAEVIRFETIVDHQSEETKQNMLPVLLIYRCEIALATKDWASVINHIEQLNTLTLHQDQQMAVTFYESQIALSQGQSELFIEKALVCLPYFESIHQSTRLSILYEALAVVSEDQRRYKEAAQYYRKLVYLLRTY